MKPNSFHRETQQRRRMIALTICSSLLLSTLLLYFILVSQYSIAGVASGQWPLFGSDGNPQQQHNSTNHDTSVTGEADENVPPGDRFLLHPQDHVHRPPQTWRLTWNVTRQTLAPDGVLKEVYLINGQFPGPTIEARSGDELEINVFNSVVDDDRDGIAIHWHGLSMQGANEMDGAVGVTQCTISPHGNMTYRFRIEEQQYGTFWYHAHSAVKRADGLYGGLIVHKPADPTTNTTDLVTFDYEAEKLLLIGDWYHRPAAAVLDWYTNPDHFAYEPAPDSLLINGDGAFNCSKAVKARPVSCTQLPVPKIHLPGHDRVRLRIVNTGASSGLSLAVDAGYMQLITVDGGSIVADTTPKTTALGVLHPGERMDVVIASSQPAKMKNTRHNLAKTTTELTVILDEENMPLINFALTTVQPFPVTWRRPKSQHPTRSVHPGQEILKVFHLSDAVGQAVDTHSRVSQSPDEKSVLYTTVQVSGTHHNQPVGDVNRTSWLLADPQAKPMLSLDPDNWPNVTKQPDKVQQLFVPHYFASNETERWMELVVNNVDDKGHPFHLHGYNFFVVATRQDELRRPYNPLGPPVVGQNVDINTETPLRKDTVYVPARGYVVLRFPLNNEGLWLMHCHVLWHQAVGMGIVMQIGEIKLSTKADAGSRCA